MAGYQFGHAQWFGQKGAAKTRSFKGHHGTQRDKGWSVSDVLAEAERLRGHCGHVASPQTPTVLFGSFAAVKQAAKTYADSLIVAIRMKDGTVRHRRARGDSPCMVGGVLSMPRDRIADWPRFRDRAIEQLQKRHGDRLKLVIEHLDEAHPHLHFYLVPEVGEDFGVVHDGYAASRKARAEPGNRVGTAYRTAMRGWQDWLQETIAKPFDLARVGPQRRRDDYQKAKARSREAELDEREAQLVEREARLFIEDAKVKKMLADIQRREGLIATKAAALAARASSVAAQQDRTRKELDRLVAENTKTVEVLRAMFVSLDAAHKHQVSLIRPDMVEKLGVANDPDLLRISNLGL